MNPASLANSIIQRITSIAPSWINLFPLVSSHSNEPDRVSFPTTTPIILPSLSAIPLQSRVPIHKSGVAITSAIGILASDIFGDNGAGNQVQGADDYWSRFYSLSGVCAAIENEEEAPQLEWDSHGLPTNIIVQLNELDSDKKYMVYDIVLFDEKSGETLSNDEPIVVDIHPGGIYNTTHLQKKLNNLQPHNSLYARVEFELKTNFDGTISIKIRFQSFTYYFLNFRCISVGLLPKRIDIVEKREHKRWIERSKPCVLPDSVQREIVNMLKKHGKVGAIVLLEIRDKVIKWYEDNGYAGARLVGLGNLGTKELVFEVMEGDITQMEFLFQDNTGNAIGGDRWDTKLPLIKKHLPKQFCVGQILNTKHAQQALENLNSLGLCSKIILEMLHDDDKEGIIVQFVLTLFTDADDIFTLTNIKRVKLALLLFSYPLI